MHWKTHRQLHTQMCAWDKEDKDMWEERWRGWQRRKVGKRQKRRVNKMKIMTVNEGRVESCGTKWGTRRKNTRRWWNCVCHPLTDNTHHGLSVNTPQLQHLTATLCGKTATASPAERISQSQTKDKTTIVEAVCEYIKKNNRSPWQLWLKRWGSTRKSAQRKTERWESVCEDQSLYR